MPSCGAQRRSRRAVSDRTGSCAACRTLAYGRIASRIQIRREGIVSWCTQVQTPSAISAPNQSRAQEDTPSPTLPPAPTAHAGPLPTSRRPRTPTPLPQESTTDANRLSYSHHTHCALACHGQAHAVGCSTASRTNSSGGPGAQRP